MSTTFRGMVEPENFPLNRWTAGVQLTRDSRMFIEIRWGSSDSRDGQVQLNPRQTIRGSRP